MAKSAYIHIPFCAHKCDFCDFAAFAGLDDLQDEYANVLVKEIEHRLSAEPNDEKLSTIFFGGGTPGYVPAIHLAQAIECLKQLCGIEDNPEITIETTPATISEDKVEAWLKAGINRISIGIESLHENELQAMGRGVQSRETAMLSVLNARKFGFENVAVDLMYGLPKQTLESFESTLNDLLSLGADHLSSYGLTIAQNSPLLTHYPLNSDEYPSEEVFVQMYESLVRIAESFGLSQYEISNFAKPGFESRHNKIYWKNEEYLAFGVSAHRYYRGKRSSNFRALKRYMREYQNNETEELINQENRIKEAIFLGLRLTAGLNLQEFEAEYFYDLSNIKGREISKLEELGLLKVSNGCMSLTQKGILISNTVLAELI